MSLQLRAETKELLQARIEEFLQRSMVSSNKILDQRESFGVLMEAEHDLPQQGPRRKLLDQFIGDYSLLAFVPDRVRVLLDQRQFEPDAERVPLSVALEGSDLKDLARDALEALETLPWAYWASLTLPSALGQLIPALEPIHLVGDRFRLIHDEDELQRTAAVEKQFGGFNSLLGLALRPAKARLALQVKIDGFAAPFSETETMLEARDLLKSFLGLSIALGMFEIEQQPAFAEPQKSMIAFTQINEDVCRDAGTMKLSYAEGVAVSRLKLADHLVTDGPPAGAIAHIATLRTILDQPEKHQLLLRASRWFFDSYVGDDPLLNFIQAMVVLEIMLGDKASSTEIGLGTLLANRCAYMIGGTTSQRNAILSSFKAIYAVRSQIVHAGKHRLTSQEQRQLFQLRWLACRVIREEIKLACEEIRRRR